MIVGVVGSRTFKDYSLLKETLNKYNIETIVSGGARGADKLSEKYADENNIKKIIIYPEWNEHGKSAGFIRNRKK